MSLLQTIKAAQLQARKDRKADAAATLTTLISEASMVGKNDGGRESTDAEVIATLKKFISNIDDVIKIAGDYRDSARADSAWAEKTLLEQFLPLQLKEDELEAIIAAFVAANGIKDAKGMGLVMRHLKESYGGLFDGNAASRITKAILS